MRCSSHYFEDGVMSLTPELVSDFHRDGFLLVRDVLDKDEAAAILGAVRLSEPAVGSRICTPCLPLAAE